MQLSKHSLSLIVTLALIVLMLPLNISAQDSIYVTNDSIEQRRAELINAYREKLKADSISIEDSIARANYIKPDPIEFPPSFFGPIVYTSYEYFDSIDFMDTKSSGVEQGPLSWINRQVYLSQQMRQVKQNYMFNNPEKVKYNFETLPAPPKFFTATVDPSKATITVSNLEVNKDNVDKTVEGQELKRINWLSSFDGSLQFSQAYISPNWYQGGNNNLNMIANAIYNIKLNQAFYPNYLFDTTVQYKLGLNSAPDDSLRSYSISEDIFRVNTKLGLKAAKSWYYSLTADFKTQLLNSYKKNTTDLAASFLAPGELNIGLGMTYDYSHPKKKLTLNASMAPLSYNLKICANDKLDETAYGIKEGHTTVSQIGSSAEFKFNWQISYNIAYTSRLFIFSNYSYVQGDWENRLSFDINRFLSTNIFVHLRYDTSADKNACWDYWQLKEILSFGFSYKFNTVK